MKRLTFMVLAAIGINSLADGVVHAHAFQIEYVTGFCSSLVSGGKVANCEKSLNYQPSGCAVYNTTPECLNEAKTYEQSLISGGNEQAGANKICTADFQKDIQLYGQAKAEEMIKSVACAFSRVMPPEPDCQFGSPSPSNPKLCVTTSVLH